MKINLSTGKTIEISYYEWLFMIEEDEVSEFYQRCIAEDLGVEIDNPFSSVKPDILEVNENNE